MSAAPGPEALLELVVDYRRAMSVFAAAKLEVFGELERPRSSAELARRRGLDPRGAEILLDALAASGFVKKTAGRYRNAPAASRFLVPNRPGYFGDNLKFQEMIWDAWGGLAGAVKRGRGARPLSHWIRRRKGFAREYVLAMENLARRSAGRVAELLSDAPAGSFLDVGSGPGAYSAALLERDPEASATLLDLPEGLELAREILARRPALENRVHFRAGDYRRVSFGRGRHGLVLMSHITHDESPQTNRRLFRKAYDALSPGGRVAVHDFTVEPERAAPEFGALFAVHMLTYTTGGRTYTTQEYAGWMKEAGFGSIRDHEIDPGAANGSRLIVGARP